jgi:hypothetical protein
MFRLASLLASMLASLLMVLPATGGSTTRVGRVKFSSDQDGLKQKQTKREEI